MLKPLVILCQISFFVHHHFANLLVLSPAEGIDNHTSLIKLVNYYQHYICSESYYFCKELQNDHETRGRVCQFRYPQNVRPTLTIAENNKDQLMFFIVCVECNRNTNEFIPFLLALWQANIDSSPIIMEEAYIQYIE